MVRNSSITITQVAVPLKTVLCDDFLLANSVFFQSNAKLLSNQAEC